MNKKGTKINIIKKIEITPEQDQSTVIQCKLYDGIGETKLFHTRVKIDKKEIIEQAAFKGGGIFLERFTKMIANAKKLSKITTINDEIGV